MFKMSHSCENHGYPVSVRGIYGFLVFNRTSRLNNSRDACFMGRFYAIGKRKKASEAITLPAMRAPP